MKASAEDMEDLNLFIAEKLEEIAPSFKGRYGFTFLAHNLEHPDRNIMVTNDPEVDGIVTEEFRKTLTSAELQVTPKAIARRITERVNELKELYGEDPS